MVRPSAQLDVPKPYECLPAGAWVMDDKSWEMLMENIADRTLVLIRDAADEHGASQVLRLDLPHTTAWSYIAPEGAFRALSKRLQDVHEPKSVAADRSRYPYMHSLDWMYAALSTMMEKASADHMHPLFSTKILAALEEHPDAHFGRCEVALGRHLVIGDRCTTRSTLALQCILSDQVYHCIDSQFVLGPRTR